jgi:hypothetical protein
MVMVPYAPAFSISITATSLSGCGVTPFFTAGEPARAGPFPAWSELHETAMIDAMTQQMISIDLIK